MSIIRVHLPGLLSVSLLTCTLGACDGGAPSEPETGTPADLVAFFSTLPSWDEFSPPLPSADEPTGAPTEDSQTIGGAPHTCSVTPHSLTSTPEAVVTLNPDVEVLWVGSLLQGKGHLGGIGSLAELPIRQRAPLALSVDLLFEGNTRTVADPTVATVNSAIGQLISDAQAAGHQAGSNIFFTQETAYSLTQASLKMGLTASYMGASVTASLAGSISEETRSVTAYFVQRMFTVSQVLPQHPEEVFSEAFTQAMLEREQTEGRMGPDNLPVFVSSVAYGRTLMFTFTSTASADSINLAVSALYNQGGFGGGAELEAGLKEILEQAEIQVVTVGGDAEAALALIRSNNLGAFFEEDAPLTTARPISYTIRNLADNSIATVSETTDYNLRTCTKDPATGATYSIKLTEIEAITDGDGYLHYEFFVQDATGPTLAARQEETFIIQNMPFLEQGGIHVLNGTPQSGVAVAVHFDGRDELRIHGSVPELFKPGLLPIVYGPFQFNRVFSGAGADLPSGTTRFSTDATYNSGPIASRLRLFFSITRTGDLFD